MNGNASSPAPVTSGIPQGSVLGPTLFVMYINDMPRAVNNRVKMFADDTKLYARSDTRELTESIQRDLTSLQKWSDDWLLVFHPQKCSTMKLGRTKSEGTNFMINPEDNTVTKLPESSLEKDLGVLVDDQLTFKEHIATATAKANRVLGVIRRSFQHLEIDTFIDLYKSMVRPILEYGHSVWQPHLKGLRRDLEDVQRRATRMVANLRQLTYPQRLEALQLSSLEHRRRR